MPHVLAPWSPETLARAINFGSEHAVRNMIVDQPHRLHEGIYGGRSDGFPPELFQVLRQSKRFRGGRCGLRFCKLRPVGFVTPDEGCQRSFLLDEFLGSSRIIDDRLDLAAVTNDPLILEQTIEVALGETRDPVEIEVTDRIENFPDLISRMNEDHRRLESPTRYRDKPETPARHRTSGSAICRRNR